MTLLSEMQPWKPKGSARTYTEAEIEATGRRHREDGIMYYPPYKWPDPGGYVPIEAITAYVRGWNSTTKYGWFSTKDDGRQVIDGKPPCLDPKNCDGSRCTRDIACNH